MHIYDSTQPSQRGYEAGRAWANRSAKAAELDRLASAYRAGFWLDGFRATPIPKPMGGAVAVTASDVMATIRPSGESRGVALFSSFGAQPADLQNGEWLAGFITGALHVHESRQRSARADERRQAAPEAESFPTRLET